MSNIDISKDDYVRFRIKIDGAFEGPSYQFDYVDVENKNANIKITFSNYEIRIRNDTDLWYKRRFRYFSDFDDKELHIFLKFYLKRLGIRKLLLWLIEGRYLKIVRMR
ncbi:hypothetical protein [Maribacter sp. Asnod1-A12]|uniref:hypothetical protein n=1 Tax=Maribacter sp. Asnod1-A12 TaxID=3160576 RepID=UPI0038675918